MCYIDIPLLQLRSVRSIIYFLFCLNDLKYIPGSFIDARSDILGTRHQKARQIVADENTSI